MSLGRVFRVVHHARVRILRIPRRIRRRASVSSANEITASHRQSEQAETGKNTDQTARYHNFSLGRKSAKG